MYNFWTPNAEILAKALGCVHVCVCVCECVNTILWGTRTVCNCNNTLWGTVEPLYNEVLGTMKITLLYQVSHYIRVKKKVLYSASQ